MKENFWANNVETNVSGIDGMGDNDQLHVGSGTMVSITGNYIWMYAAIVMIYVGLNCRGLDSNTSGRASPLLALIFITIIILLCVLRELFDWMTPIWVGPPKF